MLGMAGDRADAGDALAELLDDQVRIIGPDPVDTLRTRHGIASYRGQAGDRASAVPALARLLTDELRVLGPDHSLTLETRQLLTDWSALAEGEAHAASG
jgi:hypothetical protein